MKLGEAACHLGFGLVAGAVGTAAITLSQMIEMRIRGRNASKTPAKAVEKALGIQPVDEQAEMRLSTLTHWGYGTAWGTFRSALALGGIHGPLATGLHTTALYGTALVMLPGIGVAPPAREWGAKAIAIDLGHHLVYGAAAGLAYDWLCRNALGRPSHGSTWNWLLGGLTAVGLSRIPQIGLLRLLPESIGLLGRAPSRIERTRRLAGDLWQRDWPQARKEFEALRR